MPSSTAAYGSEPSHGHADIEERPNELSHGHVNTQAETTPTQLEPIVGGELVSIPEGIEDEDTVILQQYHDELASQEILPVCELTEEEQQMQDPMQMLIMPEHTVLFVAAAEPCVELHGHANDEDYQSSYLLSFTVT